MKSALIDISLPLDNGQWSYRAEHQNSIKEIESVLKGGRSTLYEARLFSHSGTYIETCEHKLPVERKLDEHSLSDFYGPVKVIKVAAGADGAISLDAVMTSAELAGLSVNVGDRIIICSGYGKNFQRPDYLTAAPFFLEELTDFLASKKISLIGVDSPIIENRSQPYAPVNRLFTANTEMLLLAPLMLPDELESGEYLLSCFPLPIKRISGFLCRAVLIK